MLAAMGSQNRTIFSQRKGVSGRLRKTSVAQKVQPTSLCELRSCCWVTRSRDLPAKIEELSPERMWPNVSNSSTPNFRITRVSKTNTGEGKIKCLLLKSEL